MVADQAITVPGAGQRPAPCVTAGRNQYQPCTGERPLGRLPGKGAVRGPCLPM